MPLILLIAALSALKFFEVSIFATMSWWWVIGLAAAAFLWFEFGEPLLGLDKKADAETDGERAKRERLQKNSTKR